jgi:hypothetical protein
LGGYDVDFAQRAASRGYVVFVQDARGRYTSDGERYPFLHESEDGYDTIEWIAAQPYSDGRVGMFGGSYVGATQMLAAIADPPHLAGICPVVTASDYQWFDESYQAAVWSAGTRMFERAALVGPAVVGVVFLDGPAPPVSRRTSGTAKRGTYDVCRPDCNIRERVNGKTN